LSHTPDAGVVASNVHLIHGWPCHGPREVQSKYPRLHQTGPSLMPRICVSLTAEKCGVMILDPCSKAFLTNCNTEPQQCLSFFHSISRLKPLVLRWTTVTPYTLIEGSTSPTPTIDWTLATFLGSSSISLNLELTEVQLSGRVWGSSTYQMSQSICAAAARRLIMVLF
jgi:hypothetical protein